MRSHQEAHAEAPGEHQAPWSMIEHPLVPHHEPAIIGADADLGHLIAELRAAGSFAYDSEFIGEHSYHPKLCVIQTATAKRVTLIDPLAPLDLVPFWRLLADQSVQKIVHAGTPDLEPVYRHLNVTAQNVFDTQIAAGFAGLGFPLGLAKLVHELTGAELAQGLKFSQWDHRPLSRVQVRYAANDVRYLPLVHSLLMQRLEKYGNAAWAIEECRTLSDVDLYRFDEQTQRMRVRDIESLRPRQRAILANLIAWREEAARQEDVPARTLLKDGLLVDMARWPPKSPPELNRIKGMPRPVKQHYGETMIAAITRALSGPVPDDLKRTERQGRRRYDRDADRPAVESLWSNVHDLAARRGIDAGIVTSKKEIARLRARLLNGEVQGQSRLVSGWRSALLGVMFEHGSMQNIQHRSASVMEDEPERDAGSGETPALDEIIQPNPSMP